MEWTAIAEGLEEEGSCSAARMSDMRQWSALGGSAVSNLLPWEETELRSRSSSLVLFMCSPFCTVPLRQPTMPGLVLSVYFLIFNIWDYWPWDIPTYLNGTVMVQYHSLKKPKKSLMWNYTWTWNKLILLQGE